MLNYETYQIFLLSDEDKTEEQSVQMHLNNDGDTKDGIHHNGAPATYTGR